MDVVIPKEVIHEIKIYYLSKKMALLAKKK
jgi:hypothetical protein